MQEDGRGRLEQDIQAPAPAGATFLAGGLTALVIFLLLVVFVTIRLGPVKMESRIRNTFLKVTGQKTQRVIDLPDGIRDELIGLRAVVDNAGNPTAAGSNRQLPRLISIRRCINTTLQCLGFLLRWLFKGILSTTLFQRWL